MKKFIIAALLVGASAAHAQAPELTFTLTQQDVNVIGQALGEAPYSKAAPVIVKLQKQFQDQQPKQVAPAPAEK